MKRKKKKGADKPLSSQGGLFCPRFRRLNITNIIKMSRFATQKNKISAIETFLRKKAPHIIGVKSVNHYSENFDKQSFMGKP